MVCQITRPNPQALFDRTRDMFSTTVLHGGQVIPESNEWYVVSLNYAVAEEFYAYSEQQWKEQDPRTACCENLKTLAARDGVFPYAATFAQGYIELTGVPGSVLPRSLEVTIGGSTYISEGTIDATIPADGKSVVRVRSQVPGVQSNGVVGSTGTLNAPIAGVENTIRVFGGFCGGSDAETCEQFRSRYLARKQFAPRAVNSWIEEKLLEWPCVTRVCARGGSCCTVSMGGAETCDCGTQLGFYVYMDNTFPCGIPPECVVNEINTWMFGPADQRGYGMGQAEIGVCGQIYVMRPAYINVEVSDYGCITNEQKNEIRLRIAEFFSTLCPSSEISSNQVSSIVGSVIGFNINFATEIDVASGYENEVDVYSAGCGIEMRCDVAPCLGQVTFIDSVPDGGTC